MISNFFVLSTRGDTVLAKAYHANPSSSGSTAGTDSNAAHERSHTEAFFRKVKFWTEMENSSGGGNSSAENGESSSSSNSSMIGGDARATKQNAPPVFRMADGLSYLHVKRNGLIFGCSTARNVSPSFVVELLSRIAKVFKDYCGTLSEEAIRKNFILLYELLDEIIDYGFPQVTQTENLKAFVYNEPIVVENISHTGGLVNPKTASASAVHKPVIASVSADGRRAINKNQKNEIFVDILERLNILFSNSGYILNSSIDGCIQMKSYLAGSPELRLALNEDLVIGKGESASYGAVVLDDCNFNDCVNLSEFDNARTLSFRPPDGEFVVLNYRITGEFRAPFRVFPNIEETSATVIELSCHVRAEIPENHFGANVTVEIPLPRITAAASANIISSPGAVGVRYEYIAHDQKLLWHFKKFPGGSEQTLKVKITLSAPCTSQTRREIGPISMNFEIPMYNVSNLQVRYLRIAEAIPGYTPYRWVRYVTQSNSYVCRL